VIGIIEQTANPGCRVLGGGREKGNENRSQGRKGNLLLSEKINGVSAADGRKKSDTVGREKGESVHRSQRRGRGRGNARAQEG